MAFLQDSQPDLCLLAKSGGCSVYQLRNESGEGTMTVYEVFPGATILDLYGRRWRGVRRCVR